MFFGAKARVMKPMTAIQRETLKSLKESLPPIDSRAQRTEIGLGVAKGMELLEGRGGTRYLLVMSDGELDRSGLAAQRKTRDDELALRELQALYPKLRQENIRRLHDRADRVRQENVWLAGLSRSPMSPFR